MHRSAVLLLALLAGCELPPSSSSTPMHTAVAAPQLGGSTITLSLVAGAGFTTFDSALRGCLDSKNGIDCNNYQAKDDVYMSGGPVAGGLSDGDYFFAVLTPSSQSGGFVEGALGNLSDPVAAGTFGDTGSGDPLENRTFNVRQQQVSENFGTHSIGTSPDGRLIIGLAPYDDTDDPGGVYILAICRIGASRPSDCKFDAFRVQAGGASGGATVLSFASIAGGAYYDSNANGVWDSNEPGLSGWPITYAGGGTLLTDNGTFSASMVAGDYPFVETRAGGTWVQTGNVASQCTASGGASCTLNDDRTYAAHVVDGSQLSGLFFGNLCVGTAGAHPVGSWANGEMCTVTSADLTALGTLCLRDANGQRFSPGSNAALRSWLLAGNAANPANLLSIQLATMELNLRHAFVAGQALVFAPNAAHANVNGFIDVASLVSDGQGSLCAGTDPPATQQQLDTALDQANNNLTFVQPSPASCPPPVFP